MLLAAIWAVSVAACSHPRGLREGARLQPALAALEPQLCESVPPQEPGDELLGLTAVASRGGWVAHVRRTSASTHVVVLRLQRRSAVREEVTLHVRQMRSAQEAGAHVLETLARSAPGAWAVRRGPVVVLSMARDERDAFRMATEARLPCWGTLALASAAGVFAVFGGYRQLP